MPTTMSTMKSMGMNIWNVLELLDNNLLKVRLRWKSVDNPNDHRIEAIDEYKTVQ